MDIPKVELHLHLDGACRIETAFELAKEKGIDLKVSSVEELKKAVVCTHPGNLGEVLESFYHFMPALLGDPDAIERIAYELSETLASQGVIYFETRFNPQFLSNTARNVMWRDQHPYDKKGPVDADKVIQAVLRGLKRGEKEFGIIGRILLCCIAAHPHWSREVLDLAEKYRDEGVVGIDIAGCAHGSNEDYEEINIHVFEEAAKKGIHRTIHAGEAGTAENCKHAVEVLHAERIGHGYRILGDEQIYRDITSSGIHLECCPTSSILTGAVTELDWKKHPIARFAKDKVDFSINTDDPGVMGTYFNKEIEICKNEIGLSDMQIWQCQLNGAKAAFIEGDLKQQIIEKIEKAKPKQ